MEVAHLPEDRLPDFRGVEGPGSCLHLRSAVHRVGLARRLTLLHEHNRQSSFLMLHMEIIAATYQYPCAVCSQSDPAYPVLGLPFLRRVL